MQKISFHQYRMDFSHLPLLDVRSPIEYCKGHIPSAINLPLFSNEERAEIGTIYKEKGQEQAIDKGLSIAGAKMKWYVDELKKLTSSKEIAIHCWRGGRRSSSLAWLFTFVGYKVYTIEKGYKAYRNYVLKMIDKAKLDLIILGGKTGSGKTLILHNLKKAGEQIIDLEALANHKGSAFGAIDEKEQPRSEQFENLLFDALYQLDHSKRIWVENESKGIGRVFIPEAFWSKMKDAPLVHLEIPQKERARFLARTYGSYPKVELKNSFEAIKKRIGGLALNNAIEYIDNQDLVSAAEIALQYYDKAYQHGLDVNMSPDISVLNFKQIDSIQISKALLLYVKDKREN